MQNADGHVTWWPAVGTTARQINAERQRLRQLHGQSADGELCLELDTNPAEQVGIYPSLWHLTAGIDLPLNGPLMNLMPPGDTGAGSGNDPAAAAVAASRARRRVRGAVRHLLNRTREEPSFIDAPLICAVQPGGFLGAGTANGANPEVVQAEKSICLRLRLKTLGCGLLPVGEVPARQAAVALAALAEDEARLSATALKLPAGESSPVSGPDITLLVGPRNCADLAGLVSWEFETPEQLQAMVAHLWSDFQGPLGAPIVGRLSDLEYSGLGPDGRAAAFLSVGAARILLPKRPLEAYGGTALARRAMEALTTRRSEEEVQARVTALLQDLGLDGPAGQEHQRINTCDLGFLDDQFVRGRLQEYESIRFESMEAVREAIEQAVRRQAEGNLDELWQEVQERLQEAVRSAGVDPDFGQASIPDLCSQGQAVVAEWQEEATAHQRDLGGACELLDQRAEDLMAEFEEVLERPWWGAIDKLRGRKRLTRALLQTIGEKLAADARVLAMELVSTLYVRMMDALSAAAEQAEQLARELERSHETLQDAESDWLDYRWQFESGGGLLGSGILLVDDRNLSAFFPRLLTTNEEAAIRGVVARFTRVEEVTAQAALEAAAGFIACPNVTQVFLDLPRERQQDLLKDLWRRSFPFLPLREPEQLEFYQLFAVVGATDSPIAREWSNIVRDPSWDVLPGDGEQIVAIQIVSRISLAQIEGLGDLATSFATERRAGTSLFRHQQLADLITVGADGLPTIPRQLNLPLCVLAGVLEPEQSGYRIGALATLGSLPEVRGWLVDHPACVLGAALAVAERVRLEGIDDLMAELETARSERLLTAVERDSAAAALRRCQGR